MKYIDAEKLKELIDEKWKELADKGVKVGGGKYENEIYTYLSVLRLIDSLQQEQPEVDLEKEIREYFEGWRTNWYSETEELLKNNGCTVDIDDVKEVARHFYSLGFDTRK